MKVFLLTTIFTLVVILIPTNLLARITPEDIVNSARADYQSKVKAYSQKHRQELDNLSRQIAQVNQQRTYQLKVLMDRQGQILDEEQRRNNNQTTPAIDKARYWITFAHEAVAYQAAKIYIFELTSQGNIKSDALSLISQFQADLDSTRLKVINSQKILEEVVK